MEGFTYDEFSPEVEQIARFIVKAIQDQKSIICVFCMNINE